MAEFKNNSTADQRYRKAQKDCPPHVDLIKSIREMRQIYSSMLNADFVNWYSRRYRVKAEVVWKVLEKLRKETEG